MSSSGVHWGIEEEEAIVNSCETDQVLLPARTSGRRRLPTHSQSDTSFLLPPKRAARARIRAALRKQPTIDGNSFCVLKRASPISVGHFGMAGQRWKKRFASSASAFTETAVQMEDKGFVIVDPVGESRWMKSGSPAATIPGQVDPRRRLSIDRHGQKHTAGRPEWVMSQHGSAGSLPSFHPR